MRKMLFLFILIIPFFMSSCHVNEKLSRKEKKIQENAQKKEAIQNLLANKNFVFNVETVFPRGGGSVNMGYDFDLQVRDSLVISYLPFIGTTYTTNLGGQQSGFDFTLPMKNFKMEEERKGYQVEFEVDNKSDHINFTFHVTTTGFATLTVASTQRQSITYYGTINRVK